MEKRLMITYFVGVYLLLTARARNINEFLATEDEYDQPERASYIGSADWRMSPEVTDRPEQNSYYPYSLTTDTFGSPKYPGKIHLETDARSKMINRLNYEARSLHRLGKRIATRKRDYTCDTTRLTLQTLIEYAYSGKLCGYRISGVRFGLGR